MKIAITSGKGGTGKTTVSICLFHLLSKDLKHSVQLLDCDVEEPDCNIFLRADESRELKVKLSMPVIDPVKCTFCGKCKDICAFNSIIMLPPVKFIEVVEDMCHACGACSYVCEDNAIVERDNEIGSVTFNNYHSEEDFIEGRMKIGKALQTMVIRETISCAGNFDILLIDSPPGTSCPVIAAMSPADYVIMVTEPTPFGLHDLKLMHETVKQLKKKYGIVINKAGLNYNPLYEYIQDNEIPLLGEIPFKKEYAASYSRGEILTESDDALRMIFLNILKKILNGKAI